MFKSLQRSFAKVRENSKENEESEQNTDEILTEDIKSQKIIALRDITDTCTTYKIRKDDIYMIRWLTSSDWDVETAYKRMLKFLKFKKEHPDWYFTQPLSAYEQLLKRNMAVILSNRDKFGRRIYLMHVDRMNTDEVTIEEMAQIDTLWMEMISDEPETLEKGLVIVLDMKGISWKILKWYTPQNTYYSSVFATSAEIRSFEIHLINTTTMYYTVAKLIYPFLTQSIKEKLHFHGTDLTKINEYLGEGVLPEEYSGKQGYIVDFEERNTELLKVLEAKEILLCDN